MLTMLENLERMFVAAQQCVNEYARDALLKALSIEAETLALKMSVMLKRWKQFLPFKEACDVYFETWYEKVSFWIDLLYEKQNPDARYPKFEPDDLFFIDLYQLKAKHERTDLIVQTPTYLQKTAKRINPGVPLVFSDNKPFKSSVDELLGGMRKEDDFQTSISSNCKQILMKAMVHDGFYHYGMKISIAEMQEWIETSFVTNELDGLYMECAVTALSDLHHVLCKIIDLYTGSISDDHFKRLSERIIMNYCDNIGTNVSTVVLRKRNSWPPSAVAKKAQKKKEEWQAQLRQNRWSEKLEDYIDFEDPYLYRNANFGRFLFNHRLSLTKEDVQTIYRICLEICEWNTIIYMKEEKVPTLPAQSRQLNKKDQEILDQLMDLVTKGDWTDGATAESIQAGLQRALGVGEPLPEELQKQSDQLWAMLYNRRSCDAEKSLQVTWLNIAGWCVKRGVLKCSSSPSLCKRFFKDCGEHDYKAIDKGRENPSKQFESTFKLLETCLLSQKS